MAIFNEQIFIKQMRHFSFLKMKRGNLKVIKYQTKRHQLKEI